MRHSNILRIFTIIALLIVPALAKSEKYTIGVVPQFEARQLSNIWSPILVALGESTGHEFELVGSANIPEFEQKFLRGDFDFIYSNPYHALKAYQLIKYKPIIRDGSRLLKGILVVRADSSFQSVEDLNSALISFPAPNALGASLMTRSDMTIKFGIEYSEEYVKTHSSAYLNVFLGESDAAGGVMSSFKKLDDDISSGLKILYKTESVPPHPISVHPRVPADVTSGVIETILQLGGSDSGKALLGKIPMFEPIKTDMDEYEIIENLKLDKFVK